MTQINKDTRFGILVQAVDPPEQFEELVRLVERLGFEHLWVADSSLHARSAYCYLTLAALHSERLRLGTGITQPVTRHPAIVANAVATLQEISNGRMTLGFGSGDRPVHEIGLKTARLADMRDSMWLFRKLFAGEPATMDSRLFSTNEASLVGREPLDVPIYMAASGPKTLALAGELADGVLVQVGVDPKCVSAALELIAVGARKSNRSLDELDIVLMCYGSVDTDRAVARDAARPFAAWIPQTVPRYCRIAGIPDEDVQRIKDVYEGGELMKAEHAAEVVTEQMIDAFTLAGTATEVREKIAVLTQETAVRHFAFFPMGDNRLDVVRGFADSVA